MVNFIDQMIYLSKKRDTNLGRPILDPNTLFPPLGGSELKPYNIEFA